MKLFFKKTMKSNQLYSQKFLEDLLAKSQNDEVTSNIFICSMGENEDRYAPLKTNTLRRYLTPLVTEDLTKALMDGAWRNLVKKFLTFKSVHKSAQILLQKLKTLLNERRFSRIFPDTKDFWESISPFFDENTLTDNIINLNNKW